MLLLKTPLGCAAAVLLLKTLLPLLLLVLLTDGSRTNSSGVQKVEGKKPGVKEGGGREDYLPENTRRRELQKMAETFKKKMAETFDGGRCSNMTPATNFDQRKFLARSLVMFSRSSDVALAYTCSKYVFYKEQNKLKVNFTAKFFNSYVTEKWEALLYGGINGSYQDTFGSRVMKLDERPVYYILDTDNDSYWIVCMCSKGKYCGSRLNPQTLFILASPNLREWPLHNVIRQKAQSLNETTGFALGPLWYYAQLGCDE